MSWQCPVCQTTIRVDGAAHEFAEVYRCNVCRLELVLDTSKDALVLAPPQPADEPPAQPVPERQSPGPAH